jgi:hypothetical protein
MDQLTNFYKNKSEVLAEQLKNLEAKINSLIEQAPASTFKAGSTKPGSMSNLGASPEAIAAANQQQSGKFANLGASPEAIAAANQQQSGKFAGTLGSTPNQTGKSTAELMAANKAKRMKDLANEPSQRVSQQMYSKPKQAAKAPAPPPLLARDPNVPTPPAKGQPAPVQGGTKPPVKAPAPPPLLARDPNVPTPPAQGSPAPVQGGTKPQPTSIGPNSDWANQQRASFNTGMVKDALKTTTPAQTTQTSGVPSVGQLLGTQPSPAKQPAYNFNNSSKDLMNQITNLLSGFGASKPKPAKPSMSRSELEQAAMNPSGAATPKPKGLPVNPYTGKNYQQPEAAPNAARPGTDPSSMAEIGERQRAANTPTASGRKAYEEMQARLGAKADPVNVDQFMKFRADSTGKWYDFPKK